MTQELYIIVAASAFIFIVLLAIILIDKRKIRLLQKQIEEERNKRILPLLNFSIDRRSLALCLVNEGDTMVRDISIKDIITVIDVGFQKRLGIRFSPVENLKPGESAQLNISIFDKGRAIPPTMMKRMGGVLLSASFKAYLHCKNMEGIPFRLEIIKEGQESKIGRITLVEAPKAAAPKKS